MFGIGLIELLIFLMILGIGLGGAAFVFFVVVSIHRNKQQKH